MRRYGAARNRYKNFVKQSETFDNFFCVIRQVVICAGAGYENSVSLEFDVGKRQTVENVFLYNVFHFSPVFARHIHFARMNLDKRFEFEQVRAYRRNARATTALVKVIDGVDNKTYVQSVNKRGDIVKYFLSRFRLRIAVRFPLRERILRKRLATAVARCGLLSWECSRVVPFLA